MTEPDAEERQLIQQFRERVDDILQTEEHFSDHFLMRWVRARDGNLDKAEDMIRNSFKWRNEIEIHNVLSKPLDPFILENYPYSVKGRDVDGRAVVEVHIGKWDVRKAMDCGKEEEFKHFIHYCLEDIVNEIRVSNLGRPKNKFPHTQFMYIVDWDGYTYSQLIHWKAVQYLLKFASQYEAHYPEIMYKGIFINCPSIFPMVWGLLKNVLAAKTAEKIEMFSTNREEWEPVIDMYVDKQNRGDPFGGTLDLSIEDDDFEITKL